MSERKVGPVARALLDGARFFEKKTNFCTGEFVQRWFIGLRRRYCAMGYLSHLRYAGKKKRSGTAREAYEYSNALSLLREACQKQCGIAEIERVNDSVGREAVVEIYKVAAQLALNRGL